MNTFTETDKTYEILKPVSSILEICGKSIKLNHLLKKNNIFLPHSAYLLGVIDVENILKKNEVFV